MQKTCFQFPFQVLFLLTLSLNAQNNLRFSSVDSLFQYAEKNSSAIKSGNEQALLAKWTKLAALGNTVNLRSPITASWIYNTKLPVNYIPAEALGGMPGTVKELAFGQSYVTTYGFTPQIDIINPAAWARVKSASVNEKLTETTNLITKKNLFESVSASYFNILSLQQQLTAMAKNNVAADSIFTIATNKFNAGIIREQEKNNAEINVLNVRNKLAQLNSSLEQQYNALKLLCDIQSETSLQISDTLVSSENVNIPTAIKSLLLERQQQIQSDYLKSEFRASRLLSFAPTLSLIFNQAWQKSSNAGFFDSEAHHFSTQYIGLKLSVPLPVDVTRLSLNYTAKINYSISKINSKHASLQNQISDKQLESEYQNVLSTFTTSKKINELKEANYSKSKNQYKEGILSTENLLLAFTDNVNAELSLISATSALHFTESKIKINNTVQ